MKRNLYKQENDIKSIVRNLLTAESIEYIYLNILIKSIENIPKSHDVKITYMAECIKSDHDYYSFEINQCQETFILKNGEGEYFLDHYEQIEIQIYDIDDQRISKVARKAFFEYIIECIDPNDTIELLEEESLEKFSTRRKILKWAQKKIIKKEKKIARLIAQKSKDKFSVYMPNKESIRIDKTLPDKLTDYNSFLIICLVTSASSSRSQLKIYGFKRKYDEYKKEGIVIFEASAKGSYFNWPKGLTSCIVNISKEEAIKLIEWSDYDFGLWYKNSSLALLYI